ncbi:MAG: FAD-dependent oxidoreductase, partial [Betaproteobacteria bacterium]
MDRGAGASEADLVVVGSGAAGLAAAVAAAAQGLTVVVVEKDSVCGGATAWSGGWLWVPCNPLSRADGVVEDVALARTYLRTELGAQYDPARVDALLAHGPAMVAFFETRTSLQFVSGTAIADIHGRTPGAGTGGRSVAPKPFDARAMKKSLLAIARSPKRETALFGMGVMAGPDLQRFLRATRSWDAFTYVARRL